MNRNGESSILNWTARRRFSVLQDRAKLQPSSSLLLIACDAGCPWILSVVVPGRSSATRLRDIVAVRLGVPTNGSRVRTLNSLAFSIVRDAAISNGDDPPRLVTGAEQDQILCELLSGDATDGRIRWPTDLPREVRLLASFRSELRELMTRAIELGVRPADLDRLGAASRHPEWCAASAVISQYERVLDSYRGVSLDSAEFLQAAAAEVDSGASRVPRLVVVDDAQDFTSGAAALFRACAARGTTVVAFGDPDVSSATFRGANVSLLGTIGEALGVPHTAELVLDHVYRQPVPLRRLTSAVTHRIGSAAAGRQRAARAVESGADDDNALTVVEATSRSHEAALVARFLREQHVLHGVPWSHMAVIVRSGALVDALARSLASAEVPVRTRSGVRAVRDDIAARHVVVAARVALDNSEIDPETATDLALGPLGGLDHLSLRRVKRALRREDSAGGGSRSSDDLVCDALSGASRLETIDGPSARQLAKLAANLSAARASVEAGATIDELLWTLWERSELGPRWHKDALEFGPVADEANRHLDAMVALFTAAKRFVERDPLGSSRTFIDEILAAEIPEDTLAPTRQASTVLVAAPAAVVGEEFDAVAIAGVQEGVWPNLQGRHSLVHASDLDAVSASGGESTNESRDARSAVLGDELRLFALASSRARRLVLVTAVANDDEQPSALLRFAREAMSSAPDAETSPSDGTLANAESGSRGRLETHSLSLRSLVGALRRELTVSGSRGAAASLARLAREGVPGADPDEWYGLSDVSNLEPIIEPGTLVRVSPSTLETFEKSPLAWFIDSVAVRASGIAAGIGTILHAVAEELSTTEGSALDVDAVWRGVENRWRELTFESSWIAERERRATRRKAAGISDYLRDFERAGGVLVSSEGRFEVEVGRARVVGMIDRIEKTADGSVVIVDLKTGTSVPASRTIATHAQLGSYQLALHAGAFDEVIPGVRAGAAKLVFVALGNKSTRYKEFVMGPLADDGVLDIRSRIEAAARGMAQSSFRGTTGLGEHDPHAAYEYRIHLVKAVCAS